MYYCVNCIWINGFVAVYAVWILYWVLLFDQPGLTLFCFFFLLRPLRRESFTEHKVSNGRLTRAGLNRLLLRRHVNLGCEDVTLYLYVARWSVSCWPTKATSHSSLSGGSSFTDSMCFLRIQQTSIYSTHGLVLLATVRAIEQGYTANRSLLALTIPLFHCRIYCHW